MGILFVIYVIGVIIFTAVETISFFDALLWPFMMLLLPFVLWMLFYGR